MSTQQNNLRYSEADLAEFKALIDKKLEKAQNQLASLVKQLTDTAESKDNEGDWMDGSSSTTDIEMLEVMANRQRKHIIDLQNALQRIYNHSYGICVLSGELIDKRRLLAVPTTTKSLAAKMNVSTPVKKINKPVVKTNTDSPKIITKIIRKPVVNPVPKIAEEEEVDLELETDLEFDIDTELDLDKYSEEDLD